MSLFEISDVILDKTYMSEYLVGFSLDENVLYRCHFENTRFDSADIFSSQFINCTFKEVIFYWFDNVSVLYINCNFVNVTFAGSRVENVKFLGCSFTNTLFRPDNLGVRGCKFTNTKFIECAFQSCTSINSKLIDDSLPHEIEVLSKKLEDLDFI